MILILILILCTYTYSFCTDHTNGNNNCNVESTRIECISSYHDFANNNWTSTPTRLENAEDTYGLPQFFKGKLEGQDMFWIEGNSVMDYKGLFKLNSCFPIDLKPVAIYIKYYLKAAVQSIYVFPAKDTIEKWLPPTRAFLFHEEFVELDSEYVSYESINITGPLPSLVDGNYLIVDNIAIVYGDLASQDEVKRYCWPPVVTPETTTKQPEITTTTTKQPEITTTTTSQPEITTTTTKQPEITTTTGSISIASSSSTTTELTSSNTESVISSSTFTNRPNDFTVETSTSFESSSEKILDNSAGGPNVFKLFMYILLPGLCLLAVVLIGMYFYRHYRERSKLKVGMYHQYT